MSSGKFSEVDHDLLADYVGGALDGTPEQVRVARLVEEDPAWGGAYAALAPGVELVRADLADWAAAAVPEMPLGVADRIAAALAGAGPAPAPVDTAELAAADPLDTADPLAAADPLDTAGPAHVPTPGRPDGDDAEPVVGRRNRADGHPVAGSGSVPAQATGQRRAGRGGRPAEGPGRGTGPGRGPRRWVRIAGPIALAAASIGAVGLGLNQLVATQTDTAVTADRGENAGAAGPLAAEPFRTTGPPRRSGTDYTPEQLSGASPPKVPPAAGSSFGKTAAEEDQRLSVVGGLDRLTGRDALDACLREISAEHGSGAVAVDLVDYASFQGRPALVVTFVDTAGARWAWVSGPECGVPGSGADTRFRTRVG